MCAASTEKVSGALCGRRGHGMEDVLLSEIFSRNIYHVLCHLRSAKSEFLHTEPRVFAKPYSWITQ